MKKTVATLLLGVAALIAAAAHAEDKPVYDRIAFAVSAEKEVVNDVLTATLYAEQQGQDTVALSKTVNEAITWALETAKKEPAVENRTLDYTTTPVYDDNNRISGWQVRQSIQLKSRDSNALSALLGNLQAKLRIEGIAYSVSPEVQAATEDELVGNALAAFKKRAELVKTSMGRSEYRVVRVDVQSANDFPQPFFRMAAMEAGSAAAPAPPPPSLEGGKQKLRVNVQAEIELSLN